MERGPPCSIGKVELPTAMISKLFCVESSWQGMKEHKLQVRTLPDGFFAILMLIHTLPMPRLKESLKNILCSGMSCFNVRYEKSLNRFLARLILQNETLSAEDKVRVGRWGIWISCGF